jgi:hypothetical protein
MEVSSLRPLLLLMAGAVGGGLLTFGLLHQPVQKQTDVIQANMPPRTLAAPSPGAEENNDLSTLPSPSNETITDSDEGEGPTVPKVLATLKMAQQHVPMRPLPTPVMAFQENGLPVGVTRDAEPDPEIYKRLPGIQPPLINRDGRDLGPEALQMLQTPRTEVPFPGGGTPDPSATPMPFPQTIEEANGRAHVYQSPSP